VTPYIVTLTTGIIGRHRFYRLKAVDRDPFVELVKESIESTDVEEMTPQTLGRIIGEFGTEDMLTCEEELKDHIGFTGDGQEFLRGVVSYFLALAIFARLDASKSSPNIPPYQRFGEVIRL